MSSTSTERTHPTLILAVLSLAGIAYAMLSSSVVPALPTIQRALQPRDADHVAAHGLPALRVGGNGDHRPPRRHVRQGATAAVDARHPRGGHAARGGVQLAGGDGRSPASSRAPAGGIFPLAFGIVRDEFPREKVAGSIGLLSAILGVGAGAGIVLSGVIVEHLNYHWLFWIPLLATIVAAVATWRFIPESPVRAPGRINWLAAALMTAGISTILLAISQTATWGWGSPKTIGLTLVGLAITGVWIAVEVRSANPLIDMTMMRIRGVWTANLAAFLLGAGMYASFIVFPQFAQLPKSTGFGFGASVRRLGAVPAALDDRDDGAGHLRRADLRPVRLAQGADHGDRVHDRGLRLLTLAHGHPYDLLIAAGLLGVGVGLAFAALGNLVVQAVSIHQTGVASGMNTVMRTLGGALGGQLSASFIAANTLNGEPTVTGFTDTFLMATGFLLLCLLAGALVPKTQPMARRTAPEAAHDPLTIDLAEPEGVEA